MKQSRGGGNPELSGNECTAKIARGHEMRGRWQPASEAKRKLEVMGRDEE